MRAFFSFFFHNSMLRFSSSPILAFQQLSLTLQARRRKLLGWKREEAVCSDGAHQEEVSKQRKRKLQQVVSIGECITMMDGITVGVSSHIAAPMIIFTNKNRSYPIQGLSDDVPGTIIAQYRKDGMICRYSPNGSPNHVLFIRIVTGDKSYYSWTTQ